MIRMLHNKVLVEQFNAEKETESGIVFTTKTEGQQKGRVISVGPGSYDEQGNFIEMTVKEGDVVLFSDKAKNEVSIGDKKYLVLFEPEIYGILKNT